MADWENRNPDKRTVGGNQVYSHTCLVLKKQKMAENPDPTSDFSARHLESEFHFWVPNPPKVESTLDQRARSRSQEVPHAISLTAFGRAISREPFPKKRNTGRNPLVATGLSKSRLLSAPLLKVTNF